MQVTGLKPLLLKKPPGALSQGTMCSIKDLKGPSLCLQNTGGNRARE